MTERVAKVAQEYGGRRILPGEKFDVLPQHERLLEAIGRIEPVAGAAVAQPQRGMQAVAPATYRTRDMAAERQDGAKGPKKTRNRKSLLGTVERAA